MTYEEYKQSVEQYRNEYRAGHIDIYALEGALQWLNSLTIIG